jgi:hypothetical protein
MQNSTSSWGSLFAPLVKGQQNFVVKLWDLRALKCFLNCEFIYLNYFNVLVQHIWFWLWLLSHAIRNLNHYFQMSIFFDFLVRISNLVTKCRDGETNDLNVKPSKIIWMLFVEFLDHVDWIHFILITGLAVDEVSLSTPVNLFADRFWFRHFYQREVRRCTICFHSEYLIPCLLRY